MSKYNSPTDTDLIEVIRRLQSRLDTLERSSRSSSTQVTAPILPVDWNAGGVISGNTFVSIFYFPTIWTAPTPVVTIEANCSDDTTAGEFALADRAGVELTDINGNPVVPKAIPLGTTAVTIFQNDQVPNYHRVLPTGTPEFIRLLARRTAGAGTITIRAYHIVQVPTS